jgi:predicted nuclease of predicted toxin-antitoxin system
MKILIDMNLPPSWVDAFALEGIEAVHWSSIGDIRASDRTLMQWAKENGHIVFTHDLDFGAILAATQADSPSVFQVRTQDSFPEEIGAIVFAALRQFEAELSAGALVTINPQQARARILPIGRSK